MITCKVLRIHDPFPQCGKESLLFRIDIHDKESSCSKLLHLKSLTEFKKMCIRFGIEPELDFSTDICTGVIQIQIHVRDTVDKINDMHKEWDKLVTTEGL